MNRVFVDTAHWVAVFNPGDPLFETARRAEQGLTDSILVTTEGVLEEFLNYYSGGGAFVRERACRTVETIASNARVHLVSQSRHFFIEGLRRYRARPDKSYSLTDCISMNVMDGLKIRRVLTSDRHFEQEGYEILLKT